MPDFIRLTTFNQRTAVVDDDGRFTNAAIQTLNNALQQIEAAINAIADIPAIQAALAGLDAATQAAQAAADAAQTAADTANAAADSTTATTSLANSYVDGLTLGATDAGASVTITISAHTRIYGDGTSVAVDAGSVTGASYDTLIYIYYDQPSRAGGSVTYQTTTNVSDAAQVNDRHVVGSIQTPAAGQPDLDGNPVLPPGAGAIKPTVPAL